MTATPDESELTDDVPSALRELWRDRAQRLATNVATEGREHREIAHAAALFGKDYHNRFLIELIQNANDQAVLARVLGSTVVVLRAEDYLAVSNAGEVVTRRNLERISSIADSDKAGVLVGNKGVGFKAVYQVTDTPEVFSAAEGQPEASVFEALGVGLALERHPFANQGLVAAVEADIRAFFDANAGLADKLTALGHRDFWEVVRPELEAAAGFKFPLPRTAKDLDDRAAALQVPAELRAAMRTLVVLPLRNQSAGEDAKKAIDHLVGAENGQRAQAELAVLFLPGIGELVVIDAVRNLRWTFTCRRTPGPRADRALAQATMTVTKPYPREPATTEYWLIRADVLACDAETKSKRRALVTAALKEFELEPWKPEDPLPVTVALPMPTGDEVAPLGPAGRFCVGLPTDQSTGLPAHVDARFFAKINRDGVNFDHQYNGLLLDVAVDLFGELLTQLRASDSLAVRRAATLALHRPEGAPGELATRVYRAGGIADGEVVLAWGGQHYVCRNACSLPSESERDLLPFIANALETHAGLLPEQKLLDGASEVLRTLGLPSVRTSKSHPWLSVVEQAARLNRHKGPDWWEPFVSALLACFKVAELSTVPWVPTGKVDLAVPGRRVFLPISMEPADAQRDDEEVSNVPPRVASRLQLVDETAMRLREDGRTLTDLASRLCDEKLVRRPRKTELLEDALFPALEEAVDKNDDDLALDLFAQAIAWVGSMREVSRMKLDTRRALAPAATASGLQWKKASEVYLGPGWGLGERHERLLADAYPDNRLVPLEQIEQRASGVQNAGLAATVLGICDRPSIYLIPRNGPAPLCSSWGTLRVSGQPKLGRPDLEEIYHKYLAHLATHPTRWRQGMDHDVDEIRWVDGLENPERRHHVLDLMLAYPGTYQPHTTVLRRVGHNPIHTVPQMWAFALQTQPWPIFPAERGVGGKLIRGLVCEVWLLPENVRRPAYAHLLDVIPHSLATAGSLLRAVGVYTMEEAPVRRLGSALVHLAHRLENDRLQTSQQALSLATELYRQLEDRLDTTPQERWRNGVELPLLRDYRLHCIDPSRREEAVIVFDDDAARARHIPRIDEAFRVPLRRDARIERLHDLFVKTWGASRVLRTSTAKVDLRFTPQDEKTEPFLGWLQHKFPRVEVVVELAALLTLGGERALRTERINRNWKLFERLQIQVGSFNSREIESFYDRPADLLRVSAALEPEDVVAATWELAGVRSRDLWEGYARALRERDHHSDATRTFLRAREISDVEIVDVADAAGLHRSHDIGALECALLALYCHRTPAASLDDADKWWFEMTRTPEAIAASLACPELASLLTEALAKPTPDGELLVLERMKVPWPTWQSAVLRRDGEPYRFVKSEERYRATRSHLVALVREVASRDIHVDLTALSAVLSDVVEHDAPDEVAHLPVEVARPDLVAWGRVKEALENFPALKALVESQLESLEKHSIPLEKATTRGVRLYQTEPQDRREVEAAATIQAIVNVASQLASNFGETVIPAVILGNARLAILIKGEWAHVYSAMAVLRVLLERVAPDTTKRLTDVRAFRDPIAETAVRKKLGLEDTAQSKPLPKITVIGIEVTNTELRNDLSAGSGGEIGKKLHEAARVRLDPSFLDCTRKPLPNPRSRRGGGAGGSSGETQQGLELIGDLGEAFVHEWLSTTLGDTYGAEAWRSKARERYGLPAGGNDGLGYDFEVADPEGLLFKRPCERLLIEVKSTSTDGNGSFPMSWWEWDVARRCSEGDIEGTYVILRVFEAGTAPRIGDVLIDPFAAFRRGEVRLAERDLWVTVAQRVP